jgi:ubiquinone/menaquinone biosynthesis C-methylase UbiE
METRESPVYEAQSYERFRPGYPKEVAKTIVSLAGYNSNETILEIGCGTGKGTEILIEQGATVHAIEPNVGMGKIAESKFSTEQFSWSPCTFEQFNANGKTYPLVTSAQAFHWIDQKAAFDRCHQLLRPEGALAVYRNNRKYDDEFSRREHQIQVQLNGCDPHGLWNENYYEAMAQCVTEFIKQSAGRFHRPQVYEFDHTVSYTSKEYIGLLNTFWDDSNNTPTWPRVLDQTADLIESMGGIINCTYTSVLYLMIKR